MFIIKFFYSSAFRVWSSRESSSYLRISQSTNLFQKKILLFIFFLFFFSRFFVDFFSLFLLTSDIKIHPASADKSALTWGTSEDIEWRPTSYRRKKIKNKKYIGVEKEKGERTDRKDEVKYIGNKMGGDRTDIREIEERKDKDIKKKRNDKTNNER